jgi:cellulose synthase/poly-beta-1,6-N-acetylglucosamine synthase-like glycosyltransferase
MFMIWMFWICAFLMVYVYVGYPVLARVLGRLLDRQVARAAVRPTVTVVVTAYNEQKGIKDKLDNLVALDYPAELLDIIVASDASSDDTDSIVRAYGDPRVSLLRVEGRQGKTECQNQAVRAARGEVVLFTDATTEIDRGTLVAMVENFADPQVGCVAGRLVYVDRESSLTGSGGTAYWEYELSLRIAETQLGSLVGVSGCLYAVRRSAYREMSPSLISDFVIALVMQEQRLRTVLEVNGICREETLAKSRQELGMRVRVAIRSITALVAKASLLNPFRYGLFAWQLWSHKALRYLSPVIWVLLLVANLSLLDQLLYQAALGAQLLVIGAGVAGWLLHSRQLAALAKPYYFLLTNVASMLALLRYLRGDRVTVWRTVR